MQDNNEASKRTGDNKVMPASINEILEELPEEKRKVIVGTMLAIESQSYSGPLPSPEDFKAYEQAMKGATDRIMSMTEQQMAHRIDMEKTVVKKKFFQSTLGQILATALIVFFGCIAYDLAMHDHDPAAIAIGVTTVVGLAVVFVLNKIPSIYPKEHME